MMRTADALLLLNADRPGTHRIVNAKTFEYMAAQRPILLVAPQGDLWDVVGDMTGSALCTPQDTAAIVQALATWIEQHRLGVDIGAGDWNLERFHRRTLTGQLAGLLNELTGSANAEGSGKLIESADHQPKPTQVGKGSNISTASVSPATTLQTTSE